MQLKCQLLGSGDISKFAHCRVNPGLHFEVSEGDDRDIKHQITGSQDGHQISIFVSVHVHQSSSAPDEHHSASLSYSSPGYTSRFADKHALRINI